MAVLYGSLCQPPLGLHDHYIRCGTYIANLRHDIKTLWFVYWESGFVKEFVIYKVNSDRTSFAVGYFASHLQMIKIRL